MENKEIACVLYNLCSDMDIIDYVDTEDEDIISLAKEIQFLRDNNCNNIINVLETIVLTHI